MENFPAHGCKRHNVSLLCLKQIAVPARVALSDAMESNAANGHENLGFLSETHGFMPIARPLLSMPTSHRVWDDIAQDLPALYRSQSLRRRLEEMPKLKPGAPVLDIPRGDFPVPSRTRNRRDGSASQAPAVRRLRTATMTLRLAKRGYRGLRAIASLSLARSD